MREFVTCMGLTALMINMVMGVLLYVIGTVDKPQVAGIIQMLSATIALMALIWLWDNSTKFDKR